jgi:hypothetical protein
MTLTELSSRVGVSIVNLSILKNGKAKAIRFNTLTRHCEVLGCQPGDRRGSAERHGRHGWPAGRRSIVRRAMLETCGSAEEGRTFPVIE